MRTSLGLLFVSLAAFCPANASPTEVINPPVVEPHQADIETISVTDNQHFNTRPHPRVFRIPLMKKKLLLLKFKKLLPLKFLLLRRNGGITSDLVQMVPSTNQFLGSDLQIFGDDTDLQPLSIPNDLLKDALLEEEGEEADELNYEELDADEEPEYEANKRISANSENSENPPFYIYAVPSEVEFGRADIALEKRTRGKVRHF